MNTPEKLSLWDRFFNRYKTLIKEEGKETWTESITINKFYGGEYIGQHYILDEKGMPKRRSYIRNYVVYRVIDRITGSETLEKRYLD
jgi:hypothetical protein